MLTETIEIILDNINISTKTISIAKDTVISKDGVEISRSRNRRAFVPGDIESVKTYLDATESSEIDYLNAIWTEEVIEAYQESLDQQNDI